EPYELVANGKPTGMIELPVSWLLDDAPYLWWPGATLPSGRLTFEVYKEEFDQAYSEGSLFMLTLHPMISGYRSRMKHLARLIEYIKSHPNIWFASAREIAEYV